MLHRIAAVLAAVQGAYMIADGAHRLTSGADFGRGLGPWAWLVAHARIDPLSPVMAQAFVIFGVAWLAAAAALAFGRGWYAVATLAVATLWYLPIGTAISAVVFIVALRRIRRNQLR
jgi:hypothetical protein